MIRFDYRDAMTKLEGVGTKVADLPAGTINHHRTKNTIASPDSRKLYATGGTRVFASCLRNPNGMDWQPRSGRSWTAVNKRDELGSDLVPDYLTSVQDGAFYGWPYNYYGQRGSRNRAPPSGYRVVSIPFSNGRWNGPVREVLTRFLDAEGNAGGRPVGVAIDRRGALLVADDVGNALWRVRSAALAR